MFEEYRKIWNEHGFLIIFMASIIFILILGIINILQQKTGKRSTQYIYPVQLTYQNIYNEQPQKQKRGGDSKGEIKCREVLEKLFNKPFSKIRPNFLNNQITNVNLELDCYNEELRLGLEYNGIQHYKYSKFFHKNVEAFRNQQYRDYIKRQLCKDNGIFLIEVPYTVKIENIEEFILTKLQNFNIYN